MRFKPHACGTGTRSARLLHGHHLLEGVLGVLVGLVGLAVVHRDPARRYLGPASSPHSSVKRRCGVHAVARCGRFFVRPWEISHGSADEVTRKAVTRTVAVRGWKKQRRAGRHAWRRWAGDDAGLPSGAFRLPPLPATGMVNFMKPTGQGRLFHEIS